MTKQPKTIIDIKNVSKRYGRTLALTEVSLAIKNDEIFALLGPNGAGKTTLIHILCTIQSPDQGSVTIAEKDVIKQPRQARQKLGVVFQESSLDTRLTVYENLDFHGMIYGVPTYLRRRRITEMLELVELTDWQQYLVSSLSSGMKRRLELARALIHDSKILILDEPTVGLDAQTRTRIWDYLRRLKQARDLTLLVTTHYIEEVESCDRVCILDQGKVLALDTPTNLKTTYGQELVRVQLRDYRSKQEVTARYQDRLIRQEEDTLVLLGSNEFAETFLEAFGAHVRSLRLESPSLEHVFISLTGKDLRDQAVGGEEKTYDFGKRGGEHTR